MLRWKLVLAALAGLVLLLAATPVVVAGMWEGEGADVQSPGVVSSTVSSASVSVEAGVQGVRLLVVDAQDNVVAVWSNTTDPNARVVAREGSASGLEHELTVGMMSRYENLLEELDWSRKGLVYEGP